MANDIIWDTHELDSGLKRLEVGLKGATKRSLTDCANESLRLSQMEVPHDTGSLQNSGHIEDEGEEVIVGYNMVYAARLHEHPEYIFQGGRKGKYLEDPIKRNMAVFKKYCDNNLEAMK